MAYFVAVLFHLLKQYSRLMLRIYCRRLVINKPEYLNLKGPVLFAANHPNSFLDGIILTTLMQGKLYSLARGDAFKGKWNSLLRRLRLLPVYRPSEGVENLAHNYTTFSECRNVFEQGSMVLIFSEGKCVNEWHLRPLRKGTARLAISAWDAGIDVTVIPLGFNYSSFKRFGKSVHLLFGEPLQRSAITAHAQEGRQHFYFNQQLRQQLEQLVYEIPLDDVGQQTSVFNTNAPIVKKVLLALPAAVGALLHLPFYWVATAVAGSFKEVDHYDSIMVAMLLIFYPLYLLAAIGIGWFFIGSNALWLLLLMPVCAWAYVQIKRS
ncbi:1-acyl-sn-glycerol-3-phosphate acyltransferase [Paracnuella aquatica]|uniref:1-acyl-sn-glycerol-3-phosphate acyltransferase n=1 Tax=Paracnuella aquatica TaxID=2268757 RepID=UPI000F4F30C2|nr:1-acyl-sn-glycerol-3-phosphate acyltransferase [Paracnuella aquatica]RPD48076.1 glycerol acyltransferase [Paracnuella aquatica]